MVGNPILDSTVTAEGNQRNIRANREAKQQTLPGPTVESARH